MKPTCNSEHDTVNCYLEAEHSANHEAKTTSGVIHWEVEPEGDKWWSSLLRAHGSY